MPQLLAIDDDRAILHIVRRGLAGDDLEVTTSQTAGEGLEHVRSERPDVVLLDLVMPDAKGLEVLRSLREIDPQLPVIILTAEAGSETTIEAMQLGAFEYVAKPFDVEALRDLVERAVRLRRLTNVPVALSVEESVPEGDVFVGRCHAMIEVFKTIGRVARQNVPVLIRGESGTGKELVARALFQHGSRSSGPFAEVNCAALQDTLLESELFGHEKGAFTGAEARRIGRFEQCNGGTIFLDEVGDMSPLVQGKVLRLLQHQRFERVGGSQTIQTDVRIVAATNRDLEAMVEEGTFRSDLMFRLNGVTIHLPPVRERGDDRLHLLKHFLSEASRDFNKPDLQGMSPEALDLLLAHDWPGNVREMHSVVRQAVLTATGPVIVPEFLPADFGGVSLFPGPSGGNGDDATLAAFVEKRLREGSRDLYDEAVEHMERHLFTRVLQHTDGNQTRAAEILGITRGKVRDRIAAFRISLDKSVTIED